MNGPWVVIFRGLLGTVTNLTLRLFILKLRFMPRSLVGVHAAFLAFWFRLFAIKEWRQFRQNINQIYGIPPHSNFAKLFEKQWLYHQAHCLLESVRGIYRPQDLQVEGFLEYYQLVQRLKAQQRGLIVITAHLGSWELVAKYTAQAFAESIYVLAKPIKFPGITRILQDLRTRMNSQVLRTDSKSLLKDMLGVLHAHKLLGFVMDQKPANRIGTLVDFLGAPTEFVAGPAALAIKTGCPIAAAFCVRLGPWHYKLVFKEVTADPAALGSEAALTEVLVKTMEEVIRLYPEQWTWNYKRWKFTHASAL